MIQKTSIGKFRARIYQGGVQVDAQTFDRRKDADAWEAAQRLALVRGTWANPALSTVTLGAAIDEFNEARRGMVAEHTWDTDATNLRLHVPAALKRRRMGNVTRVQLDDLFAAMMRTHARATVSRLRNAISSVYAWGTERGYVDVNPVLSSKLPKGSGQEQTSVPKPFTAVELSEAISRIEVTHPNYALLVEFAAQTGLRWGELRALRIEDIASLPYPAVLVERSRSDGYAVKVPKSRRARRVPLTPRGVELAALAARGRAPKELLFTAPRGGAILASAFTRSTGWAEAGRFHDLRHTAATRWIMSGVDIQTVSTWLGHSNAATTLRIYSHWSATESDLAGLARLAASGA